MEFPGDRNVLVFDLQHSSHDVQCKLAIIFWTNEIKFKIYVKMMPQLS